MATAELEEFQVRKSIFKAAQSAADQSLDNIKLLAIQLELGRKREENQQEADMLLLATQRKCDTMAEDAAKKSEREPEDVLSDNA